MPAARAYFAGRRVDAYLVGGRLRDILLHRETLDTDIVVAGRAFGHAKALAASLGGAAFPLDRARDISRIVWSVALSQGTLDVARMAGSDIRQDLALRDFTVNALALPLSAPWPPHPADIIDPTGGLSDLDARRLALTSVSALAADPLRLIRGVRLATELEFELAPSTGSAMRDSAHRLAGVARERVRDEFFRILVGRDAQAGVRRLWELGLLQPTLGLDLAPPASALGHIGTVRDLLAAADTPAGLQANLADYLQTPLSPGRPTFSLLVVGALLREPRDLDLAASALVLSKRETGTWARAGEAAGVALHLAEPPTDLEVHRYYRRYGAAGVAGAVLAAVLRPAPTRQIAMNLAGAWFTAPAVVQPPVWVTGQDVLALGVAPGPAVGAIIELVKEAQVLGEVVAPAGARAKALELARRLQAGRPLSTGL